MTSVTKTLNPLHFEDLEPHRFEDLVRQLLYDFRNWQKIEATGRLGSDEGFDVRAIEILNNSEREESEDEGENADLVSETRTWLVQCKREKNIAPQKMSSYVKEIPVGNDAPYGVVFAAACDFSKKTRDIFFAELREKGIMECHIWGKAELEDMLMQPKNDHLLFAYFGISLVIRRKTLKSSISSRLVTKRKAIRSLGEVDRNYRIPILLRDANDIHYPYEDAIVDFKEHPRWKQFYFVGHYENGIKILQKEYFAYVSDDKKEWDYVESHDVGRPGSEDMMRMYDYDVQEWIKINDIIRMFWINIPENNKAKYFIIKCIPYDEIIDIDKYGDETYLCPHIYVDFNSGRLVFHWEYFEIKSHKIYCEKENRIKYFPDDISKIEIEK